MIKQNYFYHTVAAVMLFIIGDAVLDMPVATAKQGDFLCFGLSLFITALAVFAGFLFVKLFNFLLKNRQAAAKISAAVICFATLFYCLFATVRFAEFTGAVICENINLLGITAIFLIAVFSGVKSGVTAVLKLCLVAGAVTVFFVLLFFFLSVSGFNENAMLTFALPLKSTVLSGILPYIKRISLPAFLLPVFLSLSLERPSKKAVAAGIGAGYGMLAVCLLNSMLVFGTLLAAKFNYPYAQAISIISVGYMFSRMDGFSYFLYFAGSLTRVTVCIITVKLLLTKAFKGEYN